MEKQRIADETAPRDAACKDVGAEANAAGEGVGMEVTSKVSASPENNRGCRNIHVRGHPSRQRC